VLLHALGSSRHVWEPVIAALSDHFDVIAVDLPGFGGSPPLPGTVTPTPAALAAAIADALDTTGVRRPHVVGNSLGGWIALELAALRPLASLTLLSPADAVISPWRMTLPPSPDSLRDLRHEPEGCNLDRDRRR
jgi:pimeloyl-ACP methyl ester carboxylesterase